ncbi:L-threonylcarbamoyladenylate synthase [Erythrobacter alti]|uniref:L-threonylcarbamoyladenylate synthase n=1 Tax=Erythrobacter alti TaxID=1896145 RepID=UPI0030F46A99
MSSKTPTIPATSEAVARAADVLREGGLVALPTETVYGLAARADGAEAVAGIYRAKGRPDFNPLIVHVRDLDHARQYGLFPDAAANPALAIWPGPLTIVVPLREIAGLAPAVTAGLPTIALRAPAHPAIRELLQHVDFPLAAPSANRSGFISPTTAQHVLASLDGRIDLVLDSGATSGGIESTILAVRDDGRWEQLRPGPVDLDALHREFFGTAMPPSRGKGAVEAPGQLTSHYAPGKPVRLNMRQPEADEFVIGFGAVAGDCSLSASGDLLEAASKLYDCLHQAAASAKPRVAVAPVPVAGIGAAINDRLERAAAV